MTERSGQFQLIFTGSRASHSYTAQCLFSECNEDTKADRNRPRFYVAAKIIDTFFRLYIYMSKMLGNQASCLSMSQSP